ncbi:MAG: glycoside hydrolase family 28 protein [Sedimentisphaerales bacterium]|nr:glycoside hydrolase family 28 protein [Sedimentisphaerales bacterium]
MVTPFEMSAIKRPTFPKRTIDVRDYGAVGDGKQVNTKAFAKAIAACAKKGGGRVLVPAGLWLTGPIHLKSKIDFHISEGAELRFSNKFSDYLPVVFTRWEGLECYNYSPLIYAKDCENIAITGAGTLNGQGEKWWKWKKTQNHGAVRLYKMACDGVAVKKRVLGTVRDALRPTFIEIVNCKNVLVEGITIGSGPMWTLHPLYCDHVLIRKVNIITRGVNNDGLIIDSTRNVLIEECFFDTGDDCVVLKSGLNEDGWRVGKPTEKVIVRNCKTKEGHGGVTIGSEMSGGIRDIFVHDCEFNCTNNGIRVKSMRGRGGVIENVWVQDVTMGRISRAALTFSTFYGMSTLVPSTKTPPVFRNFHLKNISCKYASRAVKIIGLPEQPLENFTLENITINSRWGMKCININGAKLHNVRINPIKSPVMFVKNSQDITIKKASCKERVDTFVKIEGKKTQNIKLSGNNLSKAKHKIVLGKTVDPELVKTTAR